MTKRNKKTTVIVPLTAGIDIGDRLSAYCVLNAEGDVVERKEFETRSGVLKNRFRRLRKDAGQGQERGNRHE